MAAEISIEFQDDRMLLDGNDVTAAIRTTQITSVTRHVADNQVVRRQLVKLQQEIAGREDFVTEGRDQGTVAFPNAECKIFLTASVEERAKRRHLDLQNRGEDVSLDEVLAEQNQRDERDRQRPVGGLRAAKDAVEVVTDGLTPNEVVDKLEAIVRDCMQTNAPDD